MITIENRPNFFHHNNDALISSLGHDRQLAPAPNPFVSPPEVSNRYSVRRAITSISSLEQDATTLATSDSTPRGVAWLMSFPNSGTSYTIHAVREITNTTTATNYGLEGDIKDKPSVPVFNTNKGEDGPFFELIPGRITRVPELILTKTHCAGFCTTCDPDGYMETPRSFLQGCLKSKRGFFTNKTGAMDRQSVWYHHKLVKKAVHIIRNPMDNTVARFHLERKRYTAKNDVKWLIEYPNNQDGFYKWCKEIDASRALVESRWVDDDLAISLAKVPCHSEFYRYVQWHNLAFTTVVDLEIPSFVFHYEDYSNRFEEVTDELIAFLELDRRGVAPPFVDNKRYDSYYSVEDKEHVAIFVQEFATKRTWGHLQHYFPSDSIQMEVSRAIVSVNA